MADLSKVLPRTMQRIWNFVHPQDFFWLLFMLVLVGTIPEPNNNVAILLVCIGGFQLAKPRLGFFSSKQGQVASLVIELLFSYLLVGYSHTVYSPYYPFFLIPVITAATNYGPAAIALITLLASLSYFSFLLPVFFDWTNYSLPPEFLSTLWVRNSFFAIVAFVVYQQARAKREEMTRTKLAAEMLAESNRHLREAQASLRRSERLAALGQLTAGLAHELRNPLGTIKASAQMITKPSTLNRPQIMAEMAGYIESEVDRMNGLVASFLDFARPLQVHPRVSDLNLVLDDILRSQGELALSRGVTLATERATAADAFSFDPDLLKLALGNLVQNAIQASSAGETVTLRALPGEESMLISVEDQGEGIPPQNLESIFNPFFTTKSNGVGLGLAIVSKIVDEHGGKLQVKSQPGEGTTFEMTLPKAQQLSA